MLSCVKIRQFQLKSESDNLSLHSMYSYLVTKKLTISIPFLHQIGVSNIMPKV